MKHRLRMPLIVILAISFYTSSALSQTEQMHTFITDTGYYFATSHEGKINVSSNLLDKEKIRNIPYELGDWEGYELEHDDENIVFFRAYVHSVDENAKIYFIAVHGIVESRFHTPEVCYINDSWLVKKRGYTQIVSGEKKFEAKYFTAYKGDWKHYLLYWFMWRDSKRIMNDGCIMFRIAVRATDISEDQAREYALDFIDKLSNYSAEEIEPAGQAPSAVAASVSELPNPSSPYYNVRKKSIEWLNRQMVPNDVVQSPANDRRNLILSYELPETADAYKYIFSKSSLYDNGVAVIAFTIEHQFEQASKIIDAIMRMGGTDGELFFTFNTHNTWPNKEDSWGAIIRSGASAWAGQAIVFYLRARLLDDPEIISKNTELQNYLSYAELIADNMLKRRITDNQDARYGLVTGGKGTYVLKLNHEINKVEEQFVPDEVTWCSIEHNIDMYFFLKDLGKLSSKQKYRDAAELMGKRIVAQCWNEKAGQFNRGQSAAQSDEVMALDCASWGSLFLLSRNHEKKAVRAARTAAKYSCRIEKGIGYKPYLGKPIYETYEVGKYYFPGNPKKSWDDVNMMWTEGALGVSLAYLRIGDKSKGEKVVKEVLRHSSETGGIHYSTMYVPHEFSEAPAVAPTGWLIINIGVIENNKIADLFWD
ncbi:MAG: exosortase-associated EpsI family protein [Elusimicrobia bacterium]|nr:exosortase-associated EpsI family protein [Elusimicrobiota bacterium]